MVTKEKEEAALMEGVFQRAAPMDGETLECPLWTCGTVKGWRTGIHPKRKLTEMTSLRSAAA